MSDPALKIVFYIGHHKVGSTALQAYLAQNWLPLMRSGILYPSVEGHGFAANLRDGLGKSAPSGAQPVHIREPHSALAYRMIADVSGRPIPRQFSELPSTDQMIRAIRNQVETLSPHTVILCSEAFSNFGQVNPDLVNQLGAIFPEAEIQIYCALRRPDDYLISWHGQRLKVCEQIQPLRETGASQYYGTIHFDYTMVVNAWIERLPAAQISLRNYTDIVAAGGSIEDFVQQTGLQLPSDGLTAPGRANKSLPLSAFSIMDRAVVDLDRKDAHRLSQVLQSKGHALSPIANAEIEMFGAEHRHALVETFAPFEARLAEIIEQPAFFADLDRATAARPVPEQDAARALLDAIDPASLPSQTLKDYIQSLKKEF